MKKIKNLLIYSFLIGIIILKSAFVSSASRIEDRNLYSNSPSHNSFNQTNFIEFANELFNKLNSADEADYEKIIKNEYENYPKISSSNNINTQSAFYVSNPSLSTIDRGLLLNSNSQYKILKSQDSFIITPTLVIHDKLITDEPSNENSRFLYTSANPTNNNTVKTKFASNTRTLYNVDGVKLIDSTVECRFAYNGKKAWYNNGFQYYYTRGPFSLWNVTNWRGWHEANGTSYTARSGGNFQYGLAYEGNGIIFQDFYIQNYITCTRNGGIIKGRF